MVQRTFYAYPSEAPPETEAEAPPEDVHTVRHGYNLADLDRLARRALSRSFAALGGQWRSDGYEAAFSAAVEHVLTAQERPHPEDLVRTGWHAISALYQREASHHGYSRKKDDTQQGFARYWNTLEVRRSHLEDGVVERFALWQIWPRLNAGHRQVLLALAASGDTRAAAQALGIGDNAMKMRLQRARAEFLRLWHEGEKPSRTWRATVPLGRPDPRGRRRITVSELERMRDRVGQGRTYAQIAAEFGVSRGCAAKMITGQRTPVPDREAV